MIAVYLRRWILMPFAMVITAVSLVATATASDEDEAEYFETHVRPLLIDACIDCHGDSEAEGELRLDTKEHALRGGARGNAIIPGDPDRSLLIQAVRRSGVLGSGSDRHQDLKMPPDKALSPQQVESLVRWIRAGAVWPEEEPLEKGAQVEPHWAFKAVVVPEVPSVSNHDWVRTPIDAFVMRRLEEVGLQPSPRADARALIRRVTFDLTGLPPTMSEVETFAANPSQQAWEALIDRLLDSHHYGEKWARHWLDLARYSDSKGYVYAREERFWVHAWAYRDWVVQALNDDMPYDRFLLLQIAADQVAGETGDLAAMGFLTLGRRFLGVSHDIIDDRIDVLTRSTMGLTVACARCHDHKYDPISTEDYYALYGVFRNCSERLVAIAEMPVDDEEFMTGLQERAEKLAETTTRYRDAAAERVRLRLQDYLMAQLHLEDYPEADFNQIYVDSDLIPEFVRRWRDFLDDQAEVGDTVFEAWRRYQALPESDFASQARSMWQTVRADAPRQIHPRIAAAFDSPPTCMDDVAIAYAALFKQVHDQWKESGDEGQLTDDPLLRVLYGDFSPCVVPNEPIVNIEQFLPTSQIEELWKLSGEVDRYLMNAANAPPHALVLVDKATPAFDARVLRRGNPRLLGPRVPRRFVSVLQSEGSEPFKIGSGRLELAQAITSPHNSLTARVAVNRIWQHHFGHGIVRTPSDFGRRADPPSHPELLDWMAATFTGNGWRIKDLHRMILLSSTYQQGSSVDASRFATTSELDPENRLLWRMNPRRLSFEEQRDAMLAVSGELDSTLGGRAVDLLGSTRRTLYAKVDRQFFSTLKRAFDVASPDLHIARRPETIVPQQALYFLNHSFIHDRALAIVSRVRHASDRQSVRDLYRAVFQREATDSQIDASLSFIDAASNADDDRSLDRPDEWSYGFGEYQVEVERVAGFTRLPYFDGKAWQGSSSYPDPNLGWVQLHASGGHPGNTTSHASIRRWTAPRAMAIKIESELRHEAQPGDGIRAYVVSNQSGLLKSADIHQATERFDFGKVTVQQGETIDFVVDILEVLNNDQYHWTVTIQSLDEPDQPGEWDSQRDFGGERAAPLGPWEYLAQVLLSANEFSFVD